jgi:hypothetical protein
VWNPGGDSDNDGIFASMLRGEFCFQTTRNGSSDCFRKNTPSDMNKTSCMRPAAMVGI